MMTTSYKPSPLSLNGSRQSPFRRPSSPGSPSTVIGRPSTPPSKNGASPMTSPSKLKQSFTASEQDEEDNEPPMTRPIPARSQTEPPPPLRSHTEPPPSPTTRGSNKAIRPQSNDSSAFSMSAPARNSSSTQQQPQTDVLSKLPPQLLHSMRESFSVLDSNSTGTINAASVAETMQSLGLQDQNVSQFFPYNQPQQLSLPQYLNQLANILVGLSPQQELLNAFAAFDDDDSGQVDIAELREALLHTAPDPGERALTERDIETAVDGFTGRRILGRHHAVGIAGVRGLEGATSSRKNTGDIFRYHEFLANLTGGSTSQTQTVPAR